MARARNLKPALFKNEILGVADPLLTLLFQSLWCLADKEGRLEDRPLRIKAETFPYRENIDINGYLTELQRLGFIQRYSVNGIGLIQVVNFTKHQNPHHTEKASELPSIDSQDVVLKDVSSTTDKQPLDNGEETVPLLLIPDSLLLTPDSKPSAACAAGLNADDALFDDGMLETAKPDKPKKHDYSPEFETAWAKYPKRPGANKQDAYKAWGARIKAGVSPDVMTSGVDRYARYVEAIGTQPQYVKQAETFFGPSKHYESDWTAPKQPTASPSFSGRKGGINDFGEGRNDVSRYKDVFGGRL